MCRGTNGAIVKDPASSKDARFALELLCITMANLLCVAIHMSRTTVYLLPFIKNKIPFFLYLASSAIHYPEVSTYLQCVSI